MSNANEQAFTTLTPEYVRKISELRGVDPLSWWKVQLAENAKITMINPDPENKSVPGFAGVYNSVKDFVGGPIQALVEAMKDTVCLPLAHDPIVMGNWAVVECVARTPDGGIPEAKNGASYDQRTATIMRFDPETGKIVELRYYVDSALVRDVLA